MDHRLAYASTNSRSAVNVAALKVVDLRLYAKRRPDIRYLLFLSFFFFILPFLYPSVRLFIYFYIRALYYFRL